MSTNQENTDSSAAAEVALTNALQSAERAREVGWRWLRIYVLVWALASVGLVLGIGLGTRLTTIVCLGAWALIAIGGGLWSRSLGLSPRGAGQRIGRAAGLWAASYGIVVAVGVVVDAQSIGFWVSAALFTAIPLLVAGLLPAPKTPHAA